LGVQEPMFTWTSDRSLRIEAPSGEGDASRCCAQRARRIAMALQRAGLAWIEEVVPSAASVLVVVDPRRIPTLEGERAVRKAIANASECPVDSQDGLREVVIPVCYDAEFGPDLAALATRNGITPEQVVALHASGEYVVECVGFSPGFGYLAGLPRDLHAPRLDEPRTRVPAGSVGIAGAKTGVYPQATPGGWRLIGRTAMVMFDASRMNPALLAVGDRVRFSPISREEFERQWRDARPGESL